MQWFHLPWGESLSDLLGSPVLAELLGSWVGDIIEPFSTLVEVVLGESESKWNQGPAVKNLTLAPSFWERFSLLVNVVDSAYGRSICRGDHRAGGQEAREQQHIDHDERQDTVGNSRSKPWRGHDGHLYCQLGHATHAGPPYRQWTILSSPSLSGQAMSTHDLSRPCPAMSGVAMRRAWTF